LVEVEVVFLLLEVVVFLVLGADFFALVEVFLAVEEGFLAAVVDFLTFLVEEVFFALEGRLDDDDFFAPADLGVVGLLDADVLTIFLLPALALEGRLAEVFALEGRLTDVDFFAPVVDLRPEVVFLPAGVLVFD